MGALELRVSERAADRRAAALRFVERGPATLTARSRGALDDVVHLVTQARGHTTGLRRTTLRGLALDLALVELAVRRALPLTRLGKDALVAAAIEEVLPDVEDPDVAQAMRTPGFARALARTLTELGALVDPEGALAAIDEAGGSAVPLRALHAAYGALLTAEGYAVDRGIFEAGAAILARGAAPAFATAGRVLVLDPIDLKPIEARFLATLAKHGEVLVTLPPADARGRALVADAARAASVAVDETSDAARSLVVPATFEGASDYLEAVEIARRVLAEARSGVALDRIAVAVGGRAEFTSTLALALSRAALPAQFDEGVRRPQAAGRAFLALLHYKLEGGPPARLLDYLSMGELGRRARGTELDLPPELEIAGADELEDDDDDLAPEVGRRDDASTSASADTDDDGEAPAPRAPTTQPRPRRWLRVLTSLGLARPDGEGLAATLAARCEVQRSAISAQLAATSDAAARARHTSTLADLEDIAAHLVPVLALLDAVPLRGTHREIAARLEALRLAATDASESIGRALSELSPLGGFQREVQLRAVVELLTPRLTWLSARERRARHGRVFVTTPEGLAGRVFDVVFIAGLADGVFPASAREDPVLPDALRSQLALAGHPLATSSDRQQRERTRFLTALSAAEVRAHCSYARFDVAAGRGRAKGAFHVLAERLGGERAAARSTLLWPGAPSEDAAIDTIDYALATLRGLRRAPRPGAGRFVLAGSPLLHRALVTRYQRHNRPGFNECDGLLLPRGDASLRAFSARERPYAPSALEHHAACPYKFYLHAIARVRSDDAEETDRDALAPRVFGDLYHRCQALLSHEIIERGLDLERDREEVVDRLRAVARREADALAREVLPSVPRVFAREAQRLERELEAYFALLVSEPEPYRPSHADLAFGLPLEEHLDPRSSEDDVTLSNGLRIRGAIDAVEVDPVGNHRVTDFKTGRGAEPPSRGPTRVRGGELLQPALYALAAEALLAREGHVATVVASRLYFSRESRAERTLDVTIDAATRRAALDAVDAVEEAIQHGCFMASPVAEDTCKRCAFLDVCGPGEPTRLRGKTDARLPTPLVTLTKIRGLP